MCIKTNAQIVHKFPTYNIVFSIALHTCIHHVFGKCIELGKEEGGGVGEING